MTTGVTPRRALEILREGDMEVLGLMRGSSNATFLSRVRHDGTETLAIYKPRSGETPLWDFPDGTLCLREVAAYEASELLGFSFVPPTLLRDGPHGPGSVQLFVDADVNQHYLTLPHELDDVFRAVCVFDFIINNADRKSGHCLLEESTGRVWMVDHGVSFHPDPKLRTVIWDFAGEPIPPAARDAVASFGRRLESDTSPFDELLDEPEIAALQRRTRQVLKLKVFPEPGPGRPFPWPPV